MKSGWKGSFLWFHMRSMELLDLIFMMTWFEQNIIHIFSIIPFYFMMMHIYMYAPMICIWVTWRLMVYLAQHLVHLMLEEIHLTLRWIDLWLEKIFVSSHILCYIFIILSFTDVWVRLLWVIWSLLVFLAHYLVQILVDVLHSLLGWKNTWLIILMHIIYIWITIMGDGILTYIIVAYFIGHLQLVCTWKMVVYLLGGISTFMIFLWGTSLMYIFIMLLCTFMIYIMYSWCFEEFIQENGI